MTTSSRWRPVVVAVAWAFAVGALGGLATEIGPWYRALQKPSWQPPDAAFGPAWTTIYIAAVTSAVIAWRHSAGGGQRFALLAAYAVNSALNVFWSVLFFAWRRPDWALVEVGVLWVSILVLVLLSWRRSRAAGMLLMPYLLWVSFASVLNAAIVRLNGPFTGA